MKLDVKILARPDIPGWKVELWGKGQLIGEHQLGQLRVGTLVLPVPPPENRVELPPNAPDLWNNPNQAASLFRSILARVSQGGQVETAGLYLFACLLGPQLWQKVLAHLPAEESLELRLAIDDPDLARLPWEMARFEKQFLLADKQVNIYRATSLRAAASGPLTVELPLRVLFVIAAALDDPEVNAASEYLSLLRRLQENEGLPFEIRLLSTLNGPTAATFDAIQQAIKAFQPHVLHLVAHGGVDVGRTYLQFPVENKDEDGRRDAANLEKALTGTGLRAVVLNACYSGQAPTAPSSNGKSNPGLGQEELIAQTQTVRSSIAARLVEGGIPFVVGMNGRVSDQVCRLFAREFYVSLAEGQSVPEACANGRRAGLVGQYQAEQKIDWALPVLFVPQDGPDRLELTGQERVRNLNELAREVIPPRRPDFCDRLSFLQYFQSLLVPGRPKQSALALHTAGPEGRGLGKTRLLEEMGSAAVKAGHFACLVPAEEKTDFRGYLTRTLALNIEQAAERWFSEDPFSLKQLDLTLRALNTLPVGSNLDPELTDQVKNLLKRGADDVIERRALVAALCQDLVELAKRLGPDKLVVLLFDDAHAIGTALPYFHDTLLEKGLYNVSERVRVVFAFDSFPPDRRDAAQNLLLYAQQSQWINLLQVTPFQEKEEALAYRQFVLHQEPPLVEVGTRNELFLLFQSQVKGRPGNLLTIENSRDLLKFLVQIQALSEADDRSLLTP